ncbi:uncharacterized protein APUU_70117A [Aspergillus puulaauensis]|uniref:Uncharacterized protein n=1 Tax=Aspergillus puulaauensis TaxID=1220207 RepID=A0A7R7XW62_9EURO|nr:uncharacterized protein APUU_70117A [Aspergillus puulaauensis]BCS28547.1 hypothetical protein APUU_70117A [Aspergillus puulaauensis]
MENEDVDAGHGSMDANQNSEVGVVYDPDLERVRPWSPGVNQPPGQTDGELAEDGIANPSMNTHQVPTSAYLSVDHPGDVMAAEGTVPVSALLPPAEYSDLFEDVDYPDVFEDFDFNALLNPVSPDPEAQGPANIVDDTEMPPVQQGNEDHWAGGWETIAIGDLPGLGAPSAYNASYSAPVRNINPQLLLLDNSTYGHFQGTQDNLPVCIEGPFIMKQCEVCQSMLEWGFNVEGCPCRWSIP